jgi:Tfp pilus assembly protein PilO
MVIPAGDLAPVVITIVITIAVAATIILRGPLGKGLARAMELGAGAALPPEHQSRIAQLEQRVAELESTQSRLTELEERLDFAERLLTRGEAVGRPPEIRAGQ